MRSLSRGLESGFSAGRLADVEVLEFAVPRDACGSGRLVRLGVVLGCWDGRETVLM